MQKYLTLLQLSWQTGLAYRASLVLWRLRQFISSLMSLTIWLVIFSSNTNAFGYHQQEMITYIFVASIMQSVILATALTSLARQIYTGELSQIFLKPINIFGYLAAQDLADKLKNFGFIILESVILYFIFKPQLVVPSLPIFFIFILWVLLATILHFLITILFGTLGFWSPDTWGPRFLFYMFLDFTAGKLFPLNILPDLLQKVIYLTPFPYLTFIQTKLFLGTMNPSEILYHTLALLLWIGGIGISTVLIWKKGMTNYAAAGQ